MKYESYILSADEDIVRDIQRYCGDIHAAGGKWSNDDAAHIATLLNESSNPAALFRYIDEKTGSSEVGYRDGLGREWFHILRQMRNEAGSGLLENLRYE